MSKIYLMGDLHGQLERILNIPDENLTKEDIIIVLGDFGVIWADEERTKIALELLGEKNFTLAFLDGNHENFRLIKEMENIVFWNEGYVGMLPGGVIHLLRGEIYEINDKRIGVCGGAHSIDMWHRKEGISWWPEEEITEDDFKDFKANLFNGHVMGNKLDMMLTHDCPLSMLPMIRAYAGVKNSVATQSQKLLEEMNKIADIKKWYFGHWHTDIKLNDKFQCFYYDIKEV